MDGLMFSPATCRHVLDLLGLGEHRIALRVEPPRSDQKDRHELYQSTHPSIFSRRSYPLLSRQVGGWEASSSSNCSQRDDRVTPKPLPTAR